MFLLALIACTEQVERQQTPSEAPTHWTAQHGTQIDDTVGAEVEDAARAYLDSGAVGLSIAVVRHDRVVYTGAFGWSDLDAGAPLTPDTPMGIGSTSKTLIGIAGMQAVERGELDLDAPIGDIVGVPVAHDGRSITVREVMTHHGGVYDSREYDASYASGDPEVGLREFVSEYLTPGGIYFRASHQKAPGKFRYSNVGAGLAALAVGDAVGRPFDALVQERIFEPAGMTDTSYYLRDLETPPAVGYDKGYHAYTAFGYPTYPDGMIRTTANDWAKYMLALDDDTLLSEDAKAEMLTVDPNLGSDEEGQALVWAQVGLVPGRTLMGHTGADPGIWSWFAMDQSTGTRVMVICNHSYAKDVQNVRDMYATLFDIGDAR